ncbi:hypothetical protein AB6F55_13500 [Providencia hangzhouensis]
MLYDSRLIQTVLSISWALAALLCIVIAAMKKVVSGGLWGPSIFACVIAKLFFSGIS